MNCYSGAAISYNGQGGSSYSIGVPKEKGGARFAANEWNKPQNFMQKCNRCRNSYSKNLIKHDLYSNLYDMFIIFNICLYYRTTNKLSKIQLSSFPMKSTLEMFLEISLPSGPGINVGLIFQQLRH